MSLNPVQFGTEVIDQFGRYLMTTFPIADPTMESQVKSHLRHVKAGKHTVVATGTGSGKTEAFLMPLVDHALHLRDEGTPKGITSILVYHMNALADDQLRRLRHVAGKAADEVICIGTSATVQESQGRIDAQAATRKFASRLFGVNPDHLALVTEHYRRQEVPLEKLFTPAQEADSRKLLESILDKTRQLQLRDEVSDLPDDVLMLCEQLCGQSAPEAADNMERAYRLLAGSGVLWLLIDLFKSPNLLAEALPRLRALDPSRADDEACIAELLAYLTLGALVQHEGEPLLRPKLHYFVQGYQGLGCVLDAEGKPEVKFDIEAGQAEGGERIFPLWLCRSCGQHYYKVRNAGERTRAQLELRAPLRPRVRARHRAEDFETRVIRRRSQHQTHHVVFARGIRIHRPTPRQPGDLGLGRGRDRRHGC